VPDERPIRVLVVDDEALGRRRVEDLLAHESDVEIVGTAGDGASAMSVIQSLMPDLVFLDVQMPKMTGLDVADALGDDMPPTIFVTAYDQHAVKAFELSAVDYLVKPFDDERFEQAMAKARRYLQFLKGNTASVQYAERIPVELRGEVRFVPVGDIDAIVADGAYAQLVVGEKRHLIRETMHSLESQLDPARFLRIHRSNIVAIDRIESLLRGAGGDYEVKLRNGARLAVARGRRAEVERRMGMR
jgi:two-component system LytT family response regulator